MQTSAFRTGVALATTMVATILSVTGVSHAATVTDGGFEGTLVSSFGSAPPYLVPPSYVYVPGGANATASAGPWTYTDPANSAGGGGGGLIAVTGDFNAFYGSVPPSGFGGSQFAFIQNGGSIEQTFAATPGVATLSWLEANRPNSGGIESYEVFLNGGLLGIFSGTAGAFTPVTASVVLEASNTLLFLGLFDPEIPDRTVFIDNVSIATPIPASLPLLVGGLGAMGLLVRRRKKRALAS
jgi:hypothetical protein